ADRRDMRREAVDGDDAFWRCDGGERLHESPRRVGYDRAPLRMQIRTGAKRAQLEKRDAFEAETHNRSLFRVAPAFVPQTAVGFQQLSVLAREAIQTRTAKSVFSFDQETQRDREFAKCLLIGLDG